MLRTRERYKKLSLPCKQINLTLNASIAVDLKVASFHLLFVQQTICERVDEGCANTKATEKLAGGNGFKACPNVRNILFTVVFDVVFILYLDDQNPGAAMMSSLYHNNIEHLAQF